MVPLDRRIVTLVSRDKSRFALIGGVVLFAAETVGFLFLGQINSDEGWYLYAAKLVYRGAVPYRDFSYTQMPLMPYLYGVWQVLQPSLFLGRLTSVVLSLGVWLMGIAVARRYGGRRAGALAALVAAAFTLGIYFDTIVKTYALLGFFFMATLFVFSLDLDERVKYPLAFLFAILAALVRLTGVPFAGIIFIYAILAVRPRIRVLLVLEGLGAAAAAAAWLLQDWGTAEWDLVDSHLAHWGDIGLYYQLHQVLGDRVASLVQNLGIFFLLFVASAYFVLRLGRDRGWKRDPKPLVAVMVAAAAAAAPDLFNGLWIIEYLVPSIVVSAPVLAVILSRVYAAADAPGRVFVEGALIGLLVLFPLTESIQHLDLSGKTLPAAEIDEAAAYVAQRTQPTDRVMAMEALTVLVDAQRDPLPGMAMAEFSFHPIDTPTAERLHVVNSAMMVDAIDRLEPKLILLTTNDWATLQAYDATGATAIQDAIDDHYALEKTWDRFGQFESTLELYARR